MAYFGKPRGAKKKIPVQIRVKGHAPINRTFSKKSVAVEWASEVERSIERGSTTDHNVVKATLVRDLIVRFRDTVTPNRKGCKWETNRLNAYLEETWSYLSLDKDIAGALRDWRDERLTEVLPQTVARDFKLIGPVFTHAINEWGINIDNPARRVTKPKAVNAERDVVWSEQELQSYLDAVGFDPERAPVRGEEYVPWVLLLLRQTGLRLGSLCSTRLDQIHLNVPMISFGADQVKNDEPFKCPIGSKAVETLQKLVAHRGPTKMLIPFSSGSIGTWYRQQRAVLEAANPTRRIGLRIHDLRHTWTTELIKSGRVKTELDLLKITGRKDMKSLAVYFNPTVEDLSKMLG